MALSSTAASVARAAPRALKLPWTMKAAAASALGVAKALGQEKALARKLLIHTASFTKTNHFRDFELENNDVLAACAVKSGTHWLMQIQYQIAWRGEGEFAHMHDVIPWPDGGEIFPNGITLQEMRGQQDRCPTGLNVIKTHMPPNFLPASDKFKAVTIHRAPTEIIASAYPFTQALLNARLDPADVANWMLEDGSQMYEIAKLVTGFWERRNRPNYMFINYTDIKRDPKRHIQDIAELMQVDLTTAELEKVLKKSSFEHMKKIKHQFQPPVLHSGELPFTIRKGKPGNAEKELGAELVERVERESRDIFRKVNPEFPYDEFYSE